MSRRVYALIPVAWTVVLLGLHLLFTPTGSWGRGLDVIALVAKMTACTGAALAASSFDRGDYMRRAFALHALTFGALVVRDCIAMIPPLHAAVAAAQLYDLVWRVLFVTANVAGVAAAFMMARAARLALFDTDESRYRGLVWVGLALLLALVLTGPSIVVAATNLRNGQLHNFVVLIGSIADVCAFVLTVPVVRLAYALRGGLLYIPWTLVATARMLWLVRDCFGAAPAAWWELPMFLLVAEAVRLMACTSDFSAGLAFRKMFAASDPSPDE